MSGLHWPWPILGIAPTDDRKTIREAYARLLKALDPDAATEAFMELRDARDAALSGHFLHPPQLADDDTQADDFGLGDPLDGDAAPPPPAPDPEEKPRFTVDYNDEDEQRFQRMVELFTGEGEMVPSQVEELHAHLDALLADERMADLGHYARVETWLAQLLAERYPRGAALFPRIAEHFQWSARAHELGIHPAIPWLFNAHEGHSLVRELGTPGHAYHREWIELARGKPKGPLWLRAVDKQRMGNLIATIRRDYPWLEQEHWQSDLVARWEKKTANGGVSGPNPWVWMLLLAIFFAVLPRMLDGETAPRGAGAPAVAHADAEQADKILAGFLQRQFPAAVAQGKTLETLKNGNPAIYDNLHRRANYLADDEEHADASLMKDITDRYFSAIDKLPFDRQVADARFRAAALKRMRKDPQGCAEFIDHPARYLRSGNAHMLLADDDYRNHIYSVLHDDYAGVKWILGDKKFVLPGELVGKLINRSGLSEKRVRAVFTSNQPSPSDICIVRASLLELLTEIPRAQAEKILPALL